MVVGSSLGRGIRGFTEQLFIQLCWPCALAMILTLLLSVTVGALEQPREAQTRGAEVSGAAAVRSGTDETEARAPVKILLRSPGDVPSGSAPLPETGETLSQQIEHLVRVSLATEKWGGAHGRLPETLDELIKPGEYLDEIPEDLYAPGRRVSYRLAKERQFGIVYSYGPDGDDDSGVSIPVYPFGTPGPIPDGDIVILVESRHPLEKIPVGGETGGPRILDILLDMKEQDGRDNAMIHYVEAEKVCPGPSEMTDSRFVQQVLEQGWDEGLATPDDYSAKWQPMFRKIRQAAGVDYARNIGVTNGQETAFSDLWAAQSAAKMMCYEGRYFEQRGRYEEALDDYLTVLTMGRDYGSPGGRIIHSLASVSIQEVALQSIYRLVAADKLDRLALDRLADRLEEIEKTQVPIAEVFRNEYATRIWTLEMEKQDPKRFARRREDWPEDGRSLVEDALRREDRYRKDLKNIWDFLIASAEKPNWKLDPETHKQKQAALIGGVHPLLEPAVRNNEEVDMRYRVMMTKLRLTRIVTALALYKLYHEASPESLASMVPGFLESMPVDPFSGKEFFALYSVGPDRKDDGGKVEYDATNGSMSRGDVFLR